MTAKKKTRLRRVLGWIGRAVLFIFILLAATFAYYRLRGPTEEQQAALALMRKDYRPTQGVNAFPLLFYLGYDVPADRLDAQMAVDVEKVRKWLAANPDFSSYDSDVQPLPTLSEAEKAVLCDANGMGCLAQVAAHEDAVRAALAAHAATAQSAQAFERADFFWNEFPADPRSPFFPTSKTRDSDPGLGARLWLSAFALRYAEGDRAGALAATCRNLAAWRRMARGSNVLMGTLAASLRMDGAIRLYADMLSGFPADETVPEDCALALQPVVEADVDRCAAMAGEFAMQESTLGWTSAAYPKASWFERRRLDVMFDMRQTLAWQAQNLAPACGSDAVARLLADELPRREKPGSFLFFPVPPGAKGPECIANGFGCVLAGMATLNYGQYDARALDHAAHLRLAATLLWLREHPEGSIAERFARRPAQLRSPNHESSFDTERGALYVKNLYRPSPPQEDRLRLDLPVAAAAR